MPDNGSGISEVFAECKNLGEQSEPDISCYQIVVWAVLYITFMFDANSLLFLN